jgi:hypothetical protein
VRELVEGDVIDRETMAMDATFIRAWSRRDLHDNRRGYSDPDASVGRGDREYDLGYRVHIAADVDFGLSVAYVVSPANEKRHTTLLSERVMEVIGWRVRPWW